jgi:hypothetical protein
MSLVTTSFFHILASTLNNTPVDWSLFEGFTPKDWRSFYALSKYHGVVCIVFDKIKDTPKHIAPPKDVILRWYPHSDSIERQMRYIEHLSVEFAERMAEYDIPVVVLKGSAYASYYPQPYYRESGDLDCYLMGKADLGNEVIGKIGGVLKEAGYKHSHLMYKGLTIENHRYLTNFDNTRLGIKTEHLLQEYIQNEMTPIGDTKLLNPCADFNALFLLKHAQRHFRQDDGIRMRHLLDWAFFLRAEADNIHWDKIIPIMRECRMLNFAKAITTICRERLGLDVNIEGLDDKNKDYNKLLYDILNHHSGPTTNNVYQRTMKVLRRFVHMWKFRDLLDESYPRLILLTFTYNSHYEISEVKLPEK